MKILKIFAKWSLLAFASAVVLVTGLWFFNAPADLAESSDTKARLEQAPYSFAELELRVIDRSRVTPAMGDYAGDVKRVLEGKIWFPKEPSPKGPLIVYSHGFAGYHQESRHIAKYLAGNGYVVAAVDFPLSNRQSPAGVPQLLDVANQPGDVSAVIDQVLKMNMDPNSDLYQKIDPAKVGAMGLSLGGLTTALVSFHPDLKDERLKTVVMMAPPLEGFSDRFFASNSMVNSLLVSGSFDRVVPEQANATYVKKRHPNGWFISLNKGTHLGFADIGDPIRWTENPDNLGCAFMEMMLSQLDLPERWDAVISNTQGVLRDITVGQPCPELEGESMNGLRQQWLTRVAIGSFFDMHFRSGSDAVSARKFFVETFSAENPEVSLTPPL